MPYLNLGLFTYAVNLKGPIYVYINTMQYLKKYISALLSYF